jgi:hypothetical protein
MNAEMASQIAAINTGVLGAIPPASQRLFWDYPKGSLALPETGLPRSPLEALEQGDFERVWRCAEGYAER